MAKTAIVTGATGGIGIAFVRAIHGLEDVEEIWAVGRSREKLDRLLSESDKVVPIEADLSLDGITVLSDLIREKTPDIRLLVNNAGIASFGPFAKMSEEQIGLFCRINCEAPANRNDLRRQGRQKGAEGQSAWKRPVGAGVLRKVSAVLFQVHSDKDRDAAMDENHREIYVELILIQKNRPHSCDRFRFFCFNYS